MEKAILGPVLSDIQKLACGKRFTLASAFYSASRFDALTIDAKHIDVLVRLDLKSIDEWVARTIAPDALLRCWKRHPKVKFRVFYGPAAHAKVYIGASSFLLGSANLTVRGLAGTANEILWYENDPRALRKITLALNAYKSALIPLEMVELESYVAKNLVKVTSLQKRASRSPEDSIPTSPERPPRMGTFDNFLAWLERRKVEEAASVVLARAHGQGQLSGHIKMNFFGVRQFLLAWPAYAKALRQNDPNDYKLLGDKKMATALKSFVTKEATDEGGLVVDTWRTYLPEACGGKPKSGGGTSGNLNRMLPLMARYLKL